MIERPIPKTLDPVWHKTWIKLHSRMVLDPATGCWIWQGYRLPDGHGQVKVYGRNVLVHRTMFILYNGAIRDDLVVRHSCDNPPCGNPEHLLEGTHQDNRLDCISRNRHNPQRGEDNANALLDERTVIAIKQRLAEGARQVDVAEEFGLDISNIYNIKSGRRWAHITVAEENHQAMIDVKYDQP